jgi:hypothetical protein
MAATPSQPATSDDAKVFAQLLKWLEDDPKRFEVVAKHYYDLFAYHAAQRLTTFNFFIVSLSFFSNAYATLATKGDETHQFYYVMASALAAIAWVLVVAFSRLDKRNEQIILINEGPLRRIQAIIKAQFGGDSWETFRLSNEDARPLRTFGKLLPIIYTVAGWLAALGAAYGLVLANLLSLCQGAIMASFLGLISIAAVKIPGPPRGPETTPA